jgi:hypothetical protein
MFHSLVELRLGLLGIEFVLPLFHMRELGIGHNIYTKYKLDLATEYIGGVIHILSMLVLEHLVLI